MGFSLSEKSIYSSLFSLSCTLQTSLDSFVSHPSADKHRQEMNAVLQWFTPYWKHLLSKKSIQCSLGFTCLLFSPVSVDMYLFSWLFSMLKSLWLWHSCSMVVLVYYIYFSCEKYVSFLNCIFVSWLVLTLCLFCYFSPFCFPQDPIYLHVSF